jgi:Uncharacterized homolog of phage Mu protein gp47
MARTYELILETVLARIPDKYDKREGSVLWEAVAPLCAEIAQLEIVAETMTKEAYLGTATGEYLDILAKDFGFTRKLAVPVTVKAELIGGVPQIGNKFSSVGLSDNIIYQITEQGEETNIYYMQATEVNPQANYYIGELMMVDFINDLQSANITEVVIPQTSTETDKEFRQRIENNLIAEATDGNIAQYQKWLSEIDGIGKSKITPIWNGANTVKCTILNELNKPASTELIQQVQEILDPNSEGLGMGKAPIGAIVTVDTATALNISIVTTVVFQEGKTSADKLKLELEVYLGEIALDKTAVSYLTTASVITYNKDIDYISALTINGGESNVVIPDGSVPVLLSLTVNGVDY